MCRSSLFAASLFTAALLASAQTQPGAGGLQGNWRTPGGAVVRIAACPGDAQTLCATLLQLEPHPPSRTDGKNPDPTQRTRPLCGLQIGYGFHPTSPSHADDGHLYDPKSGKTYSGAMSSSGDTLNLRGYIGAKIFGRTEQWTRTASSERTCS